MNHEPRETGAAERTYWRSLEQLADDPGAREFLEREFPVGASELPEGISRRSMLTLLGASLSMAGLAGCRRPVEKIVPYVTSPEDALPGVPKHYATTMPFGLGATGLLVKSHDGRPTKIEGNDRHPASMGSSSAQMQAEMLALYDPDRSKTLLKASAPQTWADLVAAWQALDETHRADGGAALAVLSRSFSSPSLAAAAAAFRARFPMARWATHEAVSDENILDGVAQATGAAQLPVYRFDRARVVLALDCDFLLTESEALRHARDFATARRVQSPQDGMSRLYAVEGVHSVTGANADHRLRLASGRIPAFTAALVAELQARGGSLPLVLPSREGNEWDAAWLRALADDLVAHRGAGLIVAGRRQPAAVHAAVFALNSALGNVGATVGYREPIDAAPPRRSELADLVGAMTAGQVSTLVVLGGNPVYDAPADLDFAAALGQVTTVIHLGSHVDATARAAHWHIPEAHFLEAWGDARAADGTLSVVQPLIAPLFGGKSALEVLGLLSDAEDRPAYDRVRQTWQAFLPGDFEVAWNRVLHDGVLPDSALPAGSPVLAGAADVAGLSAAAPAPAGDLELVFAGSPALFDGRYANNAWLQELPDAMTKLAWDNAALLSPATAGARDLRNEDVVTVGLDGREVQAPVWIVPGQADDCVVLHLGYGRTDGGRVATGAGFNAFLLRTQAAPDVARGATLQATGARQQLAQTQDHGSLEEPKLGPREGRIRPHVREATLTAFAQRPTFAQEVVKMPAEESPWQEHPYTEGHQWGMTIDLNTCTGCNACVIACQSENNVPVVGRQQVRNGREMHWLRMDRYFAGDMADPQTVFQAVPCMHCENAPCEQVCPVAATVHNSEGLNVMVYNRCIGTRYCLNNCPYKVRRFNFFNYTKDTPQSLQLCANPDVTVRSRGVMEKCTYCTQRINAAKFAAKLDGRPLADGDVQTACQQACPSQAIAFGDTLDAGSSVARAKAQDRNYGMLEDLYTKPRTTYLAKLRNPNPALEQGGAGKGHA